MIGSEMDTLLKAFKIKRGVWLDVGKGFGYPVGYGNWTGAVGSIIRKETDIMMHMFPASEDLFPFVGFSNSFFSNTFGILTIPKVDSTEAAKFSNLMYSKPTDTASIFVLWLFLTAIHVFQNHISKKRGRKEGIYLTFISSALDFLGVMYAKSFSRLSTRTSGRLIQSMWLLFCIVLNTAISSNLSAKLSVREYPSRVNSMQDLIETPNIQVFAGKSFFFDQFLEISQNVEIETLKHRIEIVNLESPRLIKAMYAILKGEGALVGNKFPILLTISSAFCLFLPRLMHVGKEDYSFSPLVVPYRKDLNETIVENINYGVCRVAEIGLLGRVLSRHLRRADECLTDPKEEKQYPLLLYQMESPFVILFWGMTVAFAVFVLEVVAARYIQVFRFNRSSTFEQKTKEEIKASFLRKRRLIKARFRITSNRISVLEPKTILYQKSWFSKRTNHIP